MEFRTIDWTGFEGRQEALTKQERYKNTSGKPPEFPVMFYRSNDYIHSEIGAGMVETSTDLITQVYPDLDPEELRTYFLVHDDAEIDPEYGDPQLSDKIKMTPNQLARLAKKEARAIDYVCQLYPDTINGYSYRDLLLQALRKNTLIAQIGSYFDKLEAYCESLHEVTAGNLPFVYPWKGYTNRLAEFYDKFPNLRPFLAVLPPSFAPPPHYDYFAYGLYGSPHTPTSILEPTAFPAYDLWRRVTLSKFGLEQGTKLLTTQKEFLPN